MFPAKDNQIVGNNNQNYGGSSQIGIGFHILFPPHINKVKNNNNHTADYCCEKIGIGYVPLDHGFSSINFMEIKKKASAISKDKPNLYKKSKIVGGLTRRGEITPAANQATAILPKISEDLFSCAGLSFITVRNVNTSTRQMSTSPGAGKLPYSNKLKS